MISQFHVDCAVFSSKGVDLVNGVTDSNESDAQIKKLILKAAKKRILAVDSSKFDKTSFTKICELSDIDMIVTDTKPGEGWEQVLNDSGVEIIYNK